MTNKIDFRPLAFYISYLDLLDNCLVKFIDDFNTDFGYDSDTGCWILYRNYSSKKLEQIFSEYLALELQRLIFLVERKWQNVPNKIFFICDNGSPNSEYYLTEPDIALDLNKLKLIWNRIFSKWYAVGHDNNIVFCKHNELNDCDWLYDILMNNVFGKKRVVDLSQDVKSGMKEILGINRDYTVNLKLKCNEIIVKECVQWVNSQIQENTTLGKLKK